MRYTGRGLATVSEFNSTTIFLMPSTAEHKAKHKKISRIIWNNACKEIRKQLKYKVLRGTQRQKHVLSEPGNGFLKEVEDMLGISGGDGYIQGSWSHSS